ncbi:MAG: class I SAM-dependent methyltransferase [Lentisphaerae bacterium]|nr:class I SAM-dependent methyltransferase [Lentisphaerota bacterium]MCP4100843.1 class I SAM-dependent methyltransferase [Lentisphaerota bacterium]
MVNTKKIISHGDEGQDISKSVEFLKTNIIKNNDTTFATIEEQLDILENLCKFEFGRFLIKNKGGFNGYWTHYTLRFPENGRLTNKSSDGTELTELESFMLNKATVPLATQQRYKIFLEQNGECVKENAELASIPGGLLGELLYLDYSNINNIEIYGIDLDENSLASASQLAEDLNLSKYTQTILCNAWELPYKNKFDLVSSNGLNIYESDKAGVAKLYKCFYDSLKESGKLVTSYLSYPPSFGEVCEWDIDQIDSESLRRNAAIFSSVLGAIWRNFSSKEEMVTMLELVGYKDIEVIYDNARVFPTVVAYKR